MVDYSCQLTERFLQRVLDDPGYLTMATVRRDHLEGPAAHADLPVPFNRVMIATFYLTGMDIAHRLISWLDAVSIDWERAMVIFAGQAGRPTAGVTQESHSIAGVVRAVSRGRLAAERVFIAPHAPVFPPYDPAKRQQPPRPSGRNPAIAGCGPGCAPRPTLPAACSRATRGSPPRPPSRPPSAPAPPASPPSRPEGSRRLVRPRHPAARGDGGPRATAVRRRHRLREQRARRSCQRPVRRHGPRARRRTVSPSPTKARIQQGTQQEGSHEQTKTSPSARFPVLAAARGARRHRGGGLRLGRSPPDRRPDRPRRAPSPSACRCR